MKVECYVLHVYCDNTEAHAADSVGEIREAFGPEFTGDNKREAYRAARRRGWKLGEHDLCPSCARNTG